ncbi:MAG: hypothetical protein U0W24_07735 [Bacteroidales bacterium]
MKTFYKSGILLTIVIFLFSYCTQNKELGSKLTTTGDTIFMNLNGNEYNITLSFEKGKFHNHPSFAVWIEDPEGNFIQTLFATKSVVTGIFNYGYAGNGSWKNESGKAVYPAALPYWSNKSGLNKEIPDKSQTDAISGATPKGNFVLNSKLSESNGKKFRILFEVNQTWDWNEYWNNNKYPDNQNYKSSCQPSLVYAVTVDPNQPEDEYYLNPIGHGHYAGENGKLYTDLTSFTTALKIFEKIKLDVK